MIVDIVVPGFSLIPCDLRSGRQDTHIQAVTAVMWCRQGTGLHNRQAVEAGRIRFETAHDSRKKYGYATSINSETYSVVTFQALGNQIEM